MANGNLINREACKKYILRRAAEMRRGWDCSRVSGLALDDINSQLRNKIDNLIFSHPTIGKTFNPYGRKKRKKKAVPPH